MRKGLLQLKRPIAVLSPQEKEDRFAKFWSLPSNVSEKMITSYSEYLRIDAVSQFPTGSRAAYVYSTPPPGAWASKPATESIKISRKPPIKGKVQESIERIIESIWSDVTEEEWSKLPSDLSDKIDEYLYSTER